LGADCAKRWLVFQHFGFLAFHFTDDFRFASGSRMGQFADSENSGA
jgi:hypothetical protein